mgnify:CR=1 FL=1
MPTILELFRNKQLNFPSGETADGAVKKDTETLLEQETSGIRIKSAVELNNPLIYGNEAIRIANRTTSTVESMKSQTGGEAGDGGLIGKGLGKLTGGKVSSISQARDAVNSKLGIPTTTNPSRLEGEIIKISSDTAITKDNVGQGLQGTGLGNFLKDTGGGNPKTIGKQALGKGIGLVKDKIRGKLFGSPQSIGEVVGEQIETEYTNTNPYTKVLKEERDYKSEGGEITEGENPIPFGNKSLEQIDLRLVSPIYGVQRKDNEGYFGKQPGQGSESDSYGFVNRKNPKGVQSFNSPTRPYSGKSGDPQIKSLETYSGVGRTDTINALSKADEYTVNDDGSYQIGGETIQDLIPLHIGKLGDKPTIFRSTVTGISETVTPSWSGKKFVGNPYSYYTYDGIERSVTFTIKIYCMSPIELQSNWERLTNLTKMAYPSITSGRKVNPPIIQFRLGDIYVGKIGFIDSLSHTIPDGSNWETDGDFGYLPKLIDCSITIKFIENENATAALYGYKKSKAAIEQLNEERESNNVSLGNRTNADGSLKYEEPVKLSSRGIAPLPIKISGVDTSGLGSLKGKLQSKTKDIKTGAKAMTPEQTEAGVEGEKANQSAVSDNLDGKTGIQATKESVNKDNTTFVQSLVISSLKAKYKPVTMLTKNDLDEHQFIKEEGKWANSKLVKFENKIEIGYGQIATDGEVFIFKKERK